MEWLIENKDWLFSGIAVAVPLAIVGWVFSKRSNRLTQAQKSGNSSTNIQVGGSVNIDSKGKDD